MTSGERSASNRGPSLPDRACTDHRAGLAEYALLGLIVIAGGQSHGYALSQQFGPGQPIATFLRLESAVVYYYLKKLAQRGWVSMTRTEQPPFPSRHLYHTTAPGQDALWDWIESASDASEHGRLEFLLKLFLVERLAPSRTSALAGEQYAACRHVQAELARRLGTDEVHGAAAGETHHRFPQVIVQLQLMQLQAFMGWLREAGILDNNQSASGAS